MKTGKDLKVYTIGAAFCILIIIVFIKIASYYPNWIEKNYSRGFYPAISGFFRSIFGWLPFSAGDILYAVVGLFIVIQIVKLIKNFKNRHLKKPDYKKSLVKTFFIFSIIYIWFNLSWGLNYNRPGIASQLQLSKRQHSQQELKFLTENLLKKVNECRLMLGEGKIKYKSGREVFTEAQTAFHQSATSFPFLVYNARSVKPSLYGTMGNYFGFLGYYNPFTGEAQLNLTMPQFLIPFVTCHEMAHQLGYASESEANFVGYLAAVQSPEILFHYSAYFDMFNYANNELSLKDSATAKENYNKLNPLVKKDVNELEEYWQKSDNIIEPFIKVFYDHYLKANQQTEGVKSYNDVTGWLIAYLKKYGEI